MGRFKEGQRQKSLSGTFSFALFFFPPVTGSGLGALQAASGRQGHQALQRCSRLHGLLRFATISSLSLYAPTKTQGVRKKKRGRLLSEGCQTPAPFVFSSVFASWKKRKRRSGELYESTVIWGCEALALAKHLTRLTLHVHLVGVADLRFTFPQKTAPTWCNACRRVVLFGSRPRKLHPEHL